MIIHPMEGAGSALCPALLQDGVPMKIEVSGSYKAGQSVCGSEQPEQPAGAPLGGYFIKCFPMKGIWF